MINVPKGTKDVLPEDVYKWQYIEKTAREVAEKFNAKEIRTPTFEHTEVFLRGIGETTDVVNKEMYTFKDKGDRSITLKPEGTAGVMRAFVENGLSNNVLPAKLYYITQCFRYERPQAGRLREFHQFGAEFIGSTAPEIDAEVIIFAKSFLDALNLSGYTLNINSIGCKECRKEYYAALKRYIGDNFDALCKNCKERFDKNPLRVLDCKEEGCQRILKNAPSILDYLCDDCKAHFEKVKRLLSISGIEYVIDDKIVRGLDYYTKTVFEFVSDNIGAKGTILGGGRYDGLIQELGGGNFSGVGFAAGIERMLLLMETTGVKIPQKTGVKLYVAPMGEEEAEKAFILVNELRNRGIACDTDRQKRGIKSQFKYADKIGAEYVGAIGSNELSAGKIKVKKMADGSETLISFGDLYSFISGDSE